jgi:hypothetical protein
MHDTIPHQHADEHAPHEHGHDHVRDRAHGHEQAHGHEGEHSHSNDPSHAHSHDAPHAHAPEQAPENVDNLILDIGADTGALVINAAADRDQAEVEISPAGEQARSHNIVRRREAVSGAVYAAVFPALTAGEYVVWHDAATPAGTVVVHGGRVASFRLN